MGAVCQFDLKKTQLSRMAAAEVCSGRKNGGTEKRRGRNMQCGAGGLEGEEWSKKGKSSGSVTPAAGRNEVRRGEKHWSGGGGGRMRERRKKWVQKIRGWEEGNAEEGGIVALVRCLSAKTSPTGSGLPRMVWRCLQGSKCLFVQ